MTELSPSTVPTRPTFDDYSARERKSLVAAIRQAQPVLVKALVDAAIHSDDGRCRYHIHTLANYLECDTEFVWLLLADFYLERSVATFEASPSEGVESIAPAVRTTAELIAKELPAGERARFRAYYENLLSPLFTFKLRRNLNVLALGDCIVWELLHQVRPRLFRDGIWFNQRHLYIGYIYNNALDMSQVLQLISEKQYDLLTLNFFTYFGLREYGMFRELCARGELKEAIRCMLVCERQVRSALEQIRAVSDVPIIMQNSSGLPLWWHLAGKDANRFVLAKFEAADALGRARNKLPGLKRNPLGATLEQCLGALNERVAEIAEDFDKIILIDEWGIAERIGFHDANNQIMPRGDFPDHPMNISSEVAKEHCSIMRHYVSLGKSKVVVTDFDNTLWDGVMAEGDVRHHTDRQTLLKELKNAGALLVAASKNDPGAIRWSEMTLQPDDFVATSIGWGQKADAIGELAAKLELGKDSFIFVDDREDERFLVQQAHPQVVVLDATHPETWNALRLLLKFPATSRTTEAAQRTELYRAQAKRKDAMNGGGGDPSGTLKSLQVKVNVRQARPADLGRVSELLARTNQFNCTGVRYPRELLATMIQQGTEVTLFDVEDRFGSLGIVGVTISKLDGEEAVIDGLVMSCRAMGLGVEVLMVNRIATRHASRTVRGIFKPTDRNGPAADLFQRCGFIKQDGPNWVLPPESPRPVVPDWLDVRE